METNFPTIPSDRADDLHHLEDADRADLLLFMAGSQFSWPWKRLLLGSNLNIR